MECIDTLHDLWLPIFNNLSVKKELVWHTSLTINGFECAKSAIKSVLQDIQKSTKRSALVIRASPDKTFTLVFDEDGNSVLLDSHVHLKKEKHLKRHAKKKMQGTDQGSVT